MRDETFIRLMALLPKSALSSAVGRVTRARAPASLHRFAMRAFATLYLAPRDYHRIHAPLSGQIEAYAYIAGEFWPVNPRSVRTKRALFCVNERLITFLRTPAGRCGVAKVGATCVARIRASYGD